MQSYAAEPSLVVNDSDRVDQLTLCSLPGIRERKNGMPKPVRCPDGDAGPRCTDIPDVDGLICNSLLLGIPIRFCILNL